MSLMETKTRLQKFLAQAGVCSRRKAEEYITQGLISVNGKKVTELGTKVDPQKDFVKLRGNRVRTVDAKFTILLYKPKGYVSTMSDPEGRLTVQDLIKKFPHRLFPIGRLDINTEGLILLTNDGDLAQTLTHPRHRIKKVYIAKVRGIPDEITLQRLRRGITLEGEKTGPCKVKIITTTGTNAWLEIVLREGKNRQVRRMAEAVGHPVVKLKRVGIAFLNLEGIEPGSYRHLDADEVKALKRLAKA